MAEDKITIRAETQNASAQLRDNAKAIGEVNDGLDKNEKSAKKSGASMEQMGAKVLHATTLFVALAVAVKETVGAYAEQDALNGQLARSLDRVGAAAGTLDRAQKMMRQNAREHGVAVNEQTVALKTLVEVTGDYDTAARDLQLAIDIQADSTMSLAQAGEALTKVHNGDIGALKKLQVLTKDQIKDLNKVTDETERAAIAMAFLEERFAGAAAENHGLADELAAQEEQMRNMGVAVGDVVAALGQSGAGLIGSVLQATGVIEAQKDPVEALGDSFKDLAADIREGASELEKLAKNVTWDDFIKYQTSGGMFTEEGRAALFAPVSRADSAAAQQKKREEDMAGPELGEEGFVGPVAPSASDRLAAALADSGKKKKPGKSAPEKWKASAEQIEQHAENHKEAMIKLQAEQEEALTKMVADNARARDAARMDEYRAETERLQAKADAEKEAADAKAAADKAASDAMAADVAAGADIAIAGAVSFIENEQAKAAISALIEGARATAAAASGNIPGAVAHGVAAAQFAAVAASSIGAGVSGKGGGGGGTPTAPTSSAAADRTGFLGDSRVDDGRQRGEGLTINLELSSFGKPSPEEARVAARELAREYQTQVGK